jgi:hypothetical protein
MKTADRCIHPRHLYHRLNQPHLIRLLRVGIEFLTEGTLHVERADATELLEINRGAWPLEKVKGEAERLFQMGPRRPTFGPTLPAEPDRDRAERLSV